MGDVYLRGAPIGLIERFWALDPITGASSLDNPDVVTFTIRDPDGGETNYVYGVNPNVTNPSLGVYLCELDPLLPTGVYTFRVVGAGNVQAVSEGTFSVIASGVLPPDAPTVAVTGPCSSWISGSDVSAYDPGIGVGSSAWLLDDVAYAASSLMYELSGRQYPGVCQRTVRPCSQSCSCWGGGAFGLGPFYWTTSQVSGYAAWGWQNERGDTCGCGNESYVRLSGYPVREILSVKVDGVILDPATDYRLDERRFLIRLADLIGPVPVDRFWPACQDLSVPDTEPGTYSVTYTYGADVPLLGRWAAAQLAAELWKAFPANQGECRLPNRVQRVVRAGVTIDRVVPTADLLRQGGTGLHFVDAFIAEVNPRKLRRRAAVFSPDVQRFARKLGQ